MSINRICPAWLANEREDIVQVALLRVVKVGRERANDFDFSNGYLHRTAYTHVVDEIRRRRRRRESPIEADESRSATWASAVPSPEDSAQAHQLGQAIRSCLQALVPARRRAVTLWLLGYRNREIAESLGWDPKRAENLVTRGRADLKACLSKNGHRDE